MQIADAIMLYVLQQSGSRRVLSTGKTVADVNCTIASLGPNQIACARKCEHAQRICTTERIKAAQTLRLSVVWTTTNHTNETVVQFVTVYDGTFTES